MQTCIHPSVYDIICTATAILERFCCTDSAMDSEPRHSFARSTTSVIAMADVTTSPIAGAMYEYLSLLGWLAGSAWY
jgi:hypothetical protein